MKRGSVLLVDDEPNILATVRICLENAGFEVEAYLNPVQAREAMIQRRFDLAFFDLKMQPLSGLDLLKEARRVTPSTTVVLMTAHGSVDSAVEAMKEGAYDYLQKPFEFDSLQHFAEKTFEHHQLSQEIRRLREVLHHREERPRTSSRETNP